MKLFCSPLSPFVRKVRVYAHEKGLAEGLELVHVVASPFERNNELNSCNPLGKVPCLVTDVGETVFDSRAICEYLDAISETPTMAVRHGPARRRSLKTQVLCDGILDAVVLGIYEHRLRPENIRFQHWVDAQSAKVVRALHVLEHEVHPIDQDGSIENVCVGVVLGYLDFRRPDIDWRANNENLSLWYRSFATRPSMLATAPADN